MEEGYRAVINYWYLLFFRTNRLILSAPFDGAFVSAAGALAHRDMRDDPRVVAARYRATVRGEPARRAAMVVIEGGVGTEWTPEGTRVLREQ